jgi:hypothetical protein
MGDTRAKRHIHKYYRVTIAGVRVWKCFDPMCGHYMPKHQESLVEGKATICWSCGEQTTMTGLNMEMDRPLCDDCILSARMKQLESKGIITEEDRKTGTR